MKTRERKQEGTRNRRKEKRGQEATRQRTVFAQRFFQAFDLLKLELHPRGDNKKVVRVLKIG